MPSPYHGLRHVPCMKVLICMGPENIHVTPTHAKTSLPTLLGHGIKFTFQRWDVENISSRFPWFTQDMINYNPFETTQSVNETVNGEAEELFVT